MNVAGRLFVTLGIVAYCILMQCRAAPAPGDVRRSLTSFRDVKRTAICSVIHFPPPNQHIYCCQLVDDCQCPRRMGICAPETAAASSSAASAWSLMKRILCL